MTATTHIPLHKDDHTEFYIVKNTLINVTNNFTQRELFNPKVGLSEHPIAKIAVACVQFLRDYYGIAIKVNSTFRNYVPSGAGVVSAATKSPHMLAMGIDFKFLTTPEKAADILLQLRKDFQEKGPVFQALWELGCRGFGTYDTFIHLDCVQSELYPAFAAKRGTRFEGEMYAIWDKMKVLRYKSPKYIVKPVELNLGLGLFEANIPKENVLTDNVIVDKVKETAGSVVGLFREFQNDEDQFEDYNRNNLASILLPIVALALLVLLVLFLRSKGG